MPDQQGVQSVARVSLRFGMHFGDERAGRVHIGHLPPRRLGGHDLRDAMCGEYDRSVVRAFRQLLDEHRAHGFEAPNNVGIVHDLVPYEDRCPPFGQRLLHDLDGPVDAGAESARSSKQDDERWLGHASRNGQ